jgi:predicted DNA-binding transcriptional regulator
VRETKGDELVIRLPECVPVNLRAEDGGEAQIEVSEIATAEEIELQAARQLGELIKVEEIVPNPVEPGMTLQVSRPGTPIPSDASAPPEPAVDLMNIWLRCDEEPPQGVEVEKGITIQEISLMLETALAVRDFVLEVSNERGVLQEEEVHAGWCYTARTTKSTVPGRMVKVTLRKGAATSVGEMGEHATKEEIERWLTESCETRVTISGEVPDPIPPGTELECQFGDDSPPASDALPVPELTDSEFTQASDMTKKYKGDPIPTSD